ncbi:MAG: hypothetical protein DMD46_07730 [Gemmatimonadetes bacterium]|nr:MAG: hypothetical protein DMD46_07730 [Gemmatimonadota bacterium]
MNATRLLWFLAVGLPGAAASQTAPKIAARGDAGMVWVHADGGVGVTEMKGPVLAGEGRVVFPGLAAGMGLLSGTLQAPGGGNAQHDLIEGRLFIAARALPWLELSFGPAVRAYLTDSTTERWVVWQGRAHVDAPILPQRLTSYVEAWRAFSSQVNLAAGAGRVQGGEAGVVYRPPRRTFWFRLAYHVDDAAMGTSGVSETLQSISVGVGVGSW